MIVLLLTSGHPPGMAWRKTRPTSEPPSLKSRSMMAATVRATSALLTRAVESPLTLFLVQ
jgi:hypothetical protein